MKRPRISLAVKPLAAEGTVGGSPLAGPVVRSACTKLAQEEHEEAHQQTDRGCPSVEVHPHGAPESSSWVAFRRFQANFLLQLKGKWSLSEHFTNHQHL